MIFLSFICGGTAVTLNHCLAPVYTETRRGSNDSIFWLERIDHRFIYMYMEFQVYISNRQNSNLGNETLPEIQLPTNPHNHQITNIVWIKSGYPWIVWWPHFCDHKAGGHSDCTPQHTSKPYESSSDGIFLRQISKIISQKANKIKKTLKIDLSLYKKPRQEIKMAVKRKYAILAKIIHRGTGHQTLIQSAHELEYPFKFQKWNF